MVIGNDTETSLFGILCDQKNRQASITQQNAQKIYCLVHDTKEKRDKRAEVEKGYLQDLENKSASGTLSDDEQKICEVSPSGAITAASGS